MTPSHLHDCEICSLGKQSKLRISTTPVERAKEPFEKVHTNVCGMMKVTSWGGAKYFITFIDDYTRRTWVRFMKQKSEVANIY